MVKSGIKSIVETLKESFLFSHVKEEELTQFAIKYCTQKSIKKGGLIYSANGGEKHLGIIGTGTARISNGNVILGKLKAFDIFGADALYSKTACGETITAVTECKVVFAEKEGIDYLLSKSASFAKRYISYLSQNICSLNRKISAYTSSTAEEKLYSYLLSEAKGAFASLNVKITELSEQLNLSRSSLYRAIDILEKKNKIKREGNIITLL